MENLKTNNQPSKARSTRIGAALAMTASLLGGNSASATEVENNPVSTEVNIGKAYCDEGIINIDYSLSNESDQPKNIDINVNNQTEANHLLTPREVLNGTLTPDMQGLGSYTISVTLDGGVDELYLANDEIIPNCQEVVVNPVNILYDKDKSINIKDRYKRKCKEINTIRRNGNRLSKKSRTFLIKRCGIEYPKIEGSTKNTNLENGIYYNWGAPPIEGEWLDGKGRVAIYEDGVNVSTTSVFQNVFSKDGKLKAMMPYIGSTNYFDTTVFLNKDGTSRLKSSHVEQPKPLKKPNDKEVVDFMIEQEFCNPTNKDRKVTIGIRPQKKTSKPVIEKTYKLPGTGAYDEQDRLHNCVSVVTSDSANQPPTQKQADNITFWHEDNTIINTPSREKSIARRGLKRAIYYFKIHSENSENEHFYQRSILTGYRDKYLLDNYFDKNHKFYTSSLYTPRGW